MPRSFTWRPLAYAAATFCLAQASSATALGLGEIQVQSYLYRPFDASIPVLTPTRGQRDTLSVRLADAYDFEKAGIERSEYLSTLQFDLRDSPDGARIVIHSGEIAREPYLNLVVEASWEGGRLLRVYTVLFDPPPDLRATAPAAVLPVAAPVAAPAPAVAQAAATPQPVPVAPVPRPAASADPAPSPRRLPPLPRTYGPVHAHEQPRVIAGRLYRAARVTLEQKELALYRANPQAFTDGLLGRLIPGSMLRIPALSEIRSLDRAQARATIEDLRARSGIVTPRRPAVTAPQDVAPAHDPAPTPAARSPQPAAPADPAPVPQAVTPTGPNDPVPAAPLAAASSAARESAAPLPLPSAPARALWLLLGSAVSLLIGAGAFGLLWLRRRGGRAPVPAGPVAHRLRAAEASPAFAAPIPPPATSALMSATVAAPPIAASLPAASASAAAPEPVMIPPPAEPPAVEPTSAEADPDMPSLFSDAEFWQWYGHNEAAIAALKDTVNGQPDNHYLRFRLAEACFAAGRSGDFLEQAALLQDHVDAAQRQKLAEMESKLKAAAEPAASQPDAGMALLKLSDFDLEAPASPGATTPAQAASGLPESSRPGMRRHAHSRRRGRH